MKLTTAIRRYLERQDLEEIVAIHWTEEGTAIVYERTELDLYGDAEAPGVQIRARTVGGQVVIEARRVWVEIQIADGDGDDDGYPPVLTHFHERGTGWVRLSKRSHLRVA